MKTNSKARTGSYADKVSLNSMPKVSGSNTQNIQPNQTHQDDSATQMKPTSNNTFENIIAHLQTIFPGYSRYFFNACNALFGNRNSKLSRIKYKENCFLTGYSFLTKRIILCFFPCSLSCSILELTYSVDLMFSANSSILSLRIR